MAEDIKLFHKILIVIAVLFGLSKLSEIKLFKNITNHLSQTPGKKESGTKTITRTITKYVEVPKTVIKIVEVPVAAPVEPSYSRGIISKDIPPSGTGTITYSEESETTPPPGCVHIDDDTFRRFFG